MRPRLTSDNELLESTRRCVLEHGMSVSTTVIAQHAGVSQATLFKRFGTKAELLLQALGYEEIMPWLPKFEAGPDERCIKEQLRELAHALAAFYVETLPSMMALWSAGPSYFANGTPSTDDPREASLAARGRLVLAAWLTKAQEEKRLGCFNAQAMAMAFMGACQAPAIRLHLGEDAIDVEHYVDGFVDCIWMGISG